MQTVADLCKGYIKHRRCSIKRSTAARYEGMMQKHIIPLLGDIAVGDVTRERTAEFYKALTLQGLSASAVIDIGIFLRSVMGWGSFEYGYENECRQAPLPRREKKTITVLTDAEKQTVLTYGGLYARAALLMGLRIGEVCGLMGQDVENGILSVRRTVQRIQEGEQTKVIITPPKTENSKRQIPIPKQIADELIVTPEHYIMSGCDIPYEPRRIEYNWKCFCKSAGLRDVKFHTLRHTFATTALEAGVDVKTLSEMLGHATVSTTMDLYCHPTLKHKQECMSKIWE